MENEETDDVEEFFALQRIARKKARAQRLRFVIACGVAAVLGIAGLVGVDALFDGQRIRLGVVTCAAVRALSYVVAMRLIGGDVEQGTWDTVMAILGRSRS